MKIDGYYVLEENQYNQDRFKELDWVKIDVKTLSKVLSNRKTKYDYSKEFLLTIDVSKKINEKDGAGFLAYFDTQKTIMGDGETQLEAVLDLLNAYRCVVETSI